MVRQRLSQKRIGRISLSFSTIILGGLIFLSCSTSTTKMYSGPDLTKDQVAILTNEGTSARIVSVDGKSDINRSLSGGSQIELMQGLHTIEVSYYDPGVPTASYGGGRQSTATSSKENIPIRFYAKSGHTYYLAALTGDNRWFPIIRDANGETVRPNLPFDAEVTQVLFYESGSTIVPDGQRIYRQRFPKSEARLICWELHFKYRDPGSRVDFYIDAFWYGPNYWAKLMPRFTSYVDRGQASSSYTSGFGWKEAGQWKTGSYTVEFYAEGKRIAKGSFEIY